MAHDSAPLDPPAIVIDAEADAVAELVALDRSIDSTDADGVIRRWEFGRRVLDLYQSDGVKLRKGALEDLSAQTGKSLREIKYRVQFARRYPTREELGKILPNSGNWWGVLQSFTRDHHRTKAAEESAARQSAIDPDLGDAHGDGWRMLHGDFRERLLELPEGSVDLIVTDPPYPAEFLPLLSDLSSHAARILKPQGACVVLCGKIFLPAYIARLGEYLTYGWTYAQPYPEGTGSSLNIMGRHVHEMWKPWLAFTNGTWPSKTVDWHEDLLTETRWKKKQYRWEQASRPAGEIIETLTPKRGLVLDPFAGVGTFGMAALDSGRNFIGIELDAGRFTQCVERLP